MLRNNLVQASENSFDKLKLTQSHARTGASRVVFLCLLKFSDFVRKNTTATLLFFMSLILHRLLIYPQI